MNVYGPRQDDRGAYTSVIMKVLDRLEQGSPPIIYGDGSQSYDFIYVTDAARANICATKSDAADDFFNVGAGIKTSVKELVELILRITGSDLKIEYQPSGQTFVTQRVGSTEKAKKSIGFQAKIPLDQGLRSVIEWKRREKR
jgi:UDP-glucose 4-epimerase